MSEQRHRRSTTERPRSASARNRFAGLGALFSSLCLTVGLLGWHTTEGRQSCDLGVCVEVQESRAGVRFTVQNSRYFDICLSFGLSETTNLEPSRPMPLLQLISGRARLPLVSLKPIDPDRPYSFRHEWTFSLGDPDARHDDTVLYRFPFEKGSSRLLLQGVGGSFTHTGSHRFAFDFQMAENTPVLAAREGVIVRVIDSFSKGGAFPRFKDKANLVTVRHPDGTYGEYVHLAPRGVRVREGSQVSSGQQLAASGNTGFTTDPHLHFMVWKATSGGAWESLPIRFEDGTEQGTVPEAGKLYRIPPEPGARH